ncbi:unnamed protein product [Calypogeia fissa]
MAELSDTRIGKGAPISDDKVAELWQAIFSTPTRTQHTAQQSFRWTSRCGGRREEIFVSSLSLRNCGFAAPTSRGSLFSGLWINKPLESMSFRRVGPDTTS